MEQITLWWDQVDRLGIITDEGADAWNAGHVNDILPLSGGEVLAGTNSGGVWHIHPGRPHHDDGFARPLSNAWDNPDVTSLCRGLDGPHHAFAGCRAGIGSAPVLYETAVTAIEPLVDWHPVAVPSGVGGIYRIGLAQQRRQLILASDSGVYVSRIPTAGGTWRWIQALSTTCSGLAVASAEAVVVSSLAGGSIWVGTWSGSEGNYTLTFSPATVPARFQRIATHVGRMSLAVSAGHRDHLYAVASHDDATHTTTSILAVLSSATAGRSWSWIDARAGNQSLLRNKDLTGEQGAYNNAIAAAPDDPAKVAIGWENGIFLSHNHGVDWSHHRSGPHLHDDVHALVFDPDEPKQLYIASDGGLVSTADFGGSYSSQFNKRLLNLEFESFPERNFWGNFGVSAHDRGMIGGGSQDNGVLYSFGGQTPWRNVTGGDGALALFTPQGRLVSCTNEGAASISSRNGEQFAAPTVIPVQSGHRLLDAGLADPVAEIVDTPTWSQQDEKLLAVGGHGQQDNVLYGLFANHDGSNARWRHLAALPGGAQIWSLASKDGATVYVGAMKPALVFVVDSESQSVTPLLPPPDLPGNPNDDTAVISDIVIMADGGLLVAYNTASAGGAVLRWDGQVWHVLNGSGTSLPATNYYSVAVDSIQNLYAATDDRVYARVDGGSDWTPVSDGLPLRPHCSHLRFLLHAGGASLLLVTYGRGVWRASWTMDKLPLSDAAGVAFQQLVGGRSGGPLYRATAAGVVGITVDPGTLTSLLRLFHRMLASAPDLAVAITQLRNLPLISGAIAHRADLDAALGALELGASALYRYALDADFLNASDVHARLLHASALVTAGAALLNAVAAPLDQALAHGNADSGVRRIVQQRIQEVVDAVNGLKNLEAQVLSTP